MKKKSGQIEALPEKIGPYAILQSLGKGGMGEVFLAQDPVCGRKVALKRIRAELQANPTIQSRFLREAWVASALSHPAIVPILSMETGPSNIYYTMPFVEGETLKHILRQAGEREKEGKNLFALARIFLQVCEAVAYTHAKGILHRDLKPENIIVGKYGEVMILDWGIAEFIDQIDRKEPSLQKQMYEGKDFTRPGKVTGTIAYMAPERILGKTSSVQTDIYALGVILYQMLTLKLPFRRKSIAEFRKQVHKEELVDPIEMAPYRDIPHKLSEICQKCLARSKKNRYSNMEVLIADLKSFIEGRAEWVFTAELDQTKKGDWQFQENILLAKNIAITKSLDVTEWAALMVSKRAFSENIRLETTLRFEERSEGLGFLLNAPNASSSEGYCLWLGPQNCRLFRNNVQVMEVEVPLEPKMNHKIRIEKVDDQLKLFLNDSLFLHNTFRLPLAGSHIGLLHKDTRFELGPLRIYDGSHNVLVGCLAVPNALLSHKLFDAALQEYRRIGQSFPGRMEGREALFRAGLTILEKARTQKNEKLFSAALKEFEKLARTPGAPFEYLGKSLVYEAMYDAEEEAKCLELALRKFPTHPLLSVLKEHIVYRMHESSLNSRESAYRIILLAIRHIPDLLENPDTRHLIESLEKNWEQIPFLTAADDRLTMIAIRLAFWLAKVPILIEIGKAVEANESLLNNVLLCLEHLEAHEELKKFFPHKLQEKRKGSDVEEIWEALLEKKLSKAKTLLQRHASELNQECSPFHFVYGTYLYLTEGKETAMQHFSNPLETPYPLTTVLPSLFLTGRLKGWLERAFWWEKKELHRQIELFYRCVGKNEA